MDDLRRVMFVEDDPDVFPIIEISLSNLGGFEVHGFMSGAEAVERAPEIAPQFIMLDVMMPGMDGPSTFQALRSMEMFRQTPIAFLTAKVNEADLLSLRALGAVAVLSKPFDPVTLPETIKRLWADHKARTEV